MGKIAQALKQRLQEAKQNWEERKAFDRQLEIERKREYRLAYAKGLKAKARAEGYGAGRQKGKGGTLGTLARYGESFAKAGEELIALPPSLKRQRKKKRKNDPYDLLGF